MKIKITDYEKKYKEQVIQLILDIQNKEAGINLSIFTNIVSFNKTYLYFCKYQSFNRVPLD